MLFFSLGFTVYEVLELEDLLLLVFLFVVFSYVDLFVKSPESTFRLEILFVFFVELDLFESTVVVLLLVLLFVILLLVFLLAFVLLFVALLFVFLLMWLFPMPDMNPLYDKIYTQNMSSMTDAAKGYFTVSRLPQKEGETKKLTLKDMINNKMKEAGIQVNGIFERNDLTGFNWSQVPVVLVEMGFLSNYNEDQMMSNPEYQRKLMESISNGLDEYFINK